MLEAFQLSELKFSSDALHSCTCDDQIRETKGKNGGVEKVTDFFVEAEENSGESIISPNSDRLEGEVQSVLLLLRHLLEVFK